MTHLVNKLLISLHCPGEEQALALRHNFAQTVQPQLLEAMDKVCSRQTTAEEWIQIETLEVDMGSFSPAAFGNQFGPLFQEKFEKALKEKLASVPAQQRHASRQVSQASLLVFFLKNGTLPWWATDGETDLGAISSEVLDQQPGTLLQFFYQNRFEAGVWQRAALQLPLPAKKRLVLLFDVLNQASRQLQLLFEKNFQTENSASQSGSFNAADVALHLALQHAPAIFQNAGEEQLRGIYQGFREHTERLNEAYKGAFTGSSQTITTHLTEAAPRPGQHTPEPTAARQPQATGAGNKSGFDGGAAFIETNAFAGAASGSGEPATEKYSIQTAGIALLAPFLKPFFEKLQLLEHGYWKSREAQWKGVHLLYFLSTGQQCPPEYRLVLEKLFCGMPIHAPIAMELPLAATEMAEAEQLLSSVIAHWKALKNTSISGLRNAFLQRQGIVRKTENGWLLQVEKQTLDVLLEKLPWGYATIALPWNPYFIFVEW